jgi:subtilase family serine protease
VGTYYLLACADDTDAVVESDETNNCKASATTVVISKSDLIETSVSNPPATALIGGSFSVTDTVQNQGDVSAAASTTRYYLSTDTAKDGADKRLTGSRSVPARAAGATSTGTVSVTVPNTTTVGTYYLLACADDTNAVVESNENNNCKASATTVDISP